MFHIRERVDDMIPDVLMCLMCLLTNERMTVNVSMDGWMDECTYLMYVFSI